MSSRICVNHPDKFCYICGRYTIGKQSRNITNWIGEAYNDYFNMKITNQDKSQIHGFNTKNKGSIHYPEVSSVTKPIPVTLSDSIPIPPTLNDNPAEDSDFECQDPEQDDSFTYCTDKTPKLFDQLQLNDLVRDLGLSKEKSELLGSKLQEMNLLAPETGFAWYRHRELEFLQFFSETNDLVYCNNVDGLMEKLGLEYHASEWRFFIDSSKRSLKGVLLHNGNQYASIPIAHSVHLSESYGNLEKVLVAVKYEQHQWKLCGDLKVLTMLLGQQSGYAKYPCFICQWDSRARERHWEQKDWPLRQSLDPGSHNVINEPLVDPKNVLLSPLHIKLGLMKQFVKALDKEGQCFKHLQKVFPSLSEAKIKEGVFVGPDIRILMKTTDFEEVMTKDERSAWTSFKKVVDGFWEITKRITIRNLSETC
ncbi:hypothetical protein X777_06137 [Ooceraea biroi]|uniref:Uncharacterized protein n=1 Tax=Ooceraea biroi TaxID=2015173 RepID=A0A026WE13_OOCBI|nr:hypothetical protein X777_06137 [Ooceraea biroi]